MERTEDHLVSTVRAVLESLGEQLELTAVFDDQRIPIVAASRTRTGREDERVAHAAAVEAERAAPTSSGGGWTKHRTAGGSQRQREAQVG